jgi:hypothetical protein
MRRFLLLILLSVLSACGHQIQTSSGADYVAARPGSIDTSIAEEAAIEPDLLFPARIGLARIVNGELTSPTGEEAEMFAQFSQRNRSLGDFIPISPLVVSMVTPSRQARREDVMQALRKGAARQHVDYLLVYEMGVRSTLKDTPLAIADVTIIGGFLLPTRHVKMAGVGQAALIDVRNGYPYGTASVVHDLSRLERSFGSFSRNAEAHENRALNQVAKKLVPEVEAMLTKLRQSTGR